jgi:hypothetical protein
LDLAVGINGRRAERRSQVRGIEGLYAGFERRPLNVNGCLGKERTSPFPVHRLKYTIPFTGRRILFPKRSRPLSARLLADIMSNMTVFW